MRDTCLGCNTCEKIPRIVVDHRMLNMSQQCVGGAVLGPINGTFVSRSHDVRVSLHSALVCSQKTPVLYPVMDTTL